MNSNVWRRQYNYLRERSEVFFAIGVIYACVMLTLTVVAVWPGRHISPLKSASVEILSPVVHQGAFLRVRFIVDKVRVCDAYTTQLVIDDEGVVAALLPTLGTVFSLGERTRTFSIRLPRELEPGNYRYESIFVHECTNPRGTFLTNPDGDGTFTVVAP